METFLKKVSKFDRDLLEHHDFFKKGIYGVMEFGNYCYVPFNEYTVSESYL
jgi:hypothetical protein